MVWYTVVFWTGVPLETHKRRSLPATRTRGKTEIALPFVKTFLTHEIRQFGELPPNLLGIPFLFCNIIRYGKHLQYYTYSRPRGVFHLVKLSAQFFSKQTFRL